MGTPFEGINETYEYKGYIIYYEPRKDGFYWLTVTFGPDENYCYNSKISPGYGVVILIE